MMDYSRIESAGQLPPDPETPETAPPPLPFVLMRIPGLIFSPTRLFRSLKEDPAFWGALILGIAIVALSGFLIPAEVWVDWMRTQAIEAGSEVPENTAMLGRVMKITTTGGALVGVPIALLLQAGLFKLLFTFGMGYQGSYREYFAIAAHVMLLTAIGGLLLIPLRISTGNPTLGLGLGTFFPSLEVGFLFRLLQSLDFFAIWGMALMGLGASVLDGTRPARTSIAVALLAYLVFAVLISTLGGLRG